MNVLLPRNNIHICKIWKQARIKYLIRGNKEQLSLLAKFIHSSRLIKERKVERVKSLNHSTLLLKTFHLIRHILQHKIY